MRPIALDTNTYVGFKRGDPTCVEVIRQAKRLLMSTFERVPGLRLVRSWAEVLP